MKVLIILMLLICQFAQAKPDRIVLDQSNVKVVVNVSNNIQNVKINSKHYFESLNSQSSLSDYITEKMNLIFEQMSLNHSVDGSDNNYTHQLTISESQRLMSTKGLEPYTINWYLKGQGLYKEGKQFCAYHNLSISFIDLKTNKSIQFNSNHPYDSIKTKDLEMMKCDFGKVMEKNKMKWKKAISSYKEEHKGLIFDAVKEKIIPNLMKSLFDNGLFKSEKHANEYMIEALKDEYLLIEKNNDLDFLVDGQLVKKDEIRDKIFSMAQASNKSRILIGFKTKSKFTYGDISNIFKRVFKKTDFKLYRLGQHTELVFIK